VLNIWHFTLNPVRFAIFYMHGTFLHPGGWFWIAIADIDVGMG